MAKRKKGKSPSKKGKKTAVSAPSINIKVPSSEEDVILEEAEEPHYINRKKEKVSEASEKQKTAAKSVKSKQKSQSKKKKKTESTPRKPQTSQLKQEKPETTIESQPPTETASITEKSEAAKPIQESSEEVTQEVEPEIIPEAEPEIVQEVEPEIIPETELEIVPEVEPEIIPETGLEIVPEVEPEIIPEVELVLSEKDEKSEQETLPATFFKSPPFYQTFLALLISPSKFFEVTFLKLRKSSGYLSIALIIYFSVYSIWILKLSSRTFLLKAGNELWTTLTHILIPILLLPLVHFIAISLKKSDKAQTKENLQELASVLFYALGTSYIIAAIIYGAIFLINLWMSLCGTITIWDYSALKTAETGLNLSLLYSFYIIEKGVSATYLLPPKYSFIPPAIYPFLIMVKILTAKQ